MNILVFIRHPRMLAHTEINCQTISSRQQCFISLLSVIHVSVFAEIHFNILELLIVLTTSSQVEKVIGYATLET